MVANDKVSCESNTSRLQEMVRNLEHMYLLLHSDDWVVPTNEAFQLYNLISRHVRHYILMFYVGKGSNSHELICCEKPDKEVIKGSTNSVIKYSCPSGKQVIEKADDVWCLFGYLSTLLYETRTHFSKMHAVERSRGNRTPQSQFNQSQAKKRKCRDDDDVINCREHCLAEILRSLEDMGRARSYAAPSNREIRYYQEIRKLTNSSRAIMKTRPAWERSLRTWHSITGESQRNIQLRNSSHGSSEFGVDYAPTGYKLAIAVDEIQDLLSIVRESKSRFLEINLSFLKGEKLSTCDVPCIEGGADKDDPVSSIWCSKKRYRSDFNNAATSTEKQNEITREQYLQDILQLLKKLGPLMSDAQLQIEELSLYGQLVEHVTSSIMIYEHEHWNGRVKSYAPIDFGSAEDANKLPETSVPFTITREQCLVKIVQLVEVIRSSFLGATPTESDIILYREIETQLNTEVLHGAAAATCKGMSSSSSCWPWLRSVYDLELILFKEMEEELKQMLRSIYPKWFESDDPLKMLEEFGESDDKLSMLATINELKDPYLVRAPHSLNVVDQLILILVKFHPLFDDFMVSLVRSHEDMDSRVAGGVANEVTVEVSSAFDVLLLQPISSVVIGT